MNNAIAPCIFIRKQEQLVDFTQSDLSFIFFIIIFASMLFNLMKQIIQAKVVFK